MNKNMISIIIPAHNAAGTIENTVQSVIKQGNNDLIEIVVIENGSTDNTIEIIEKLSSQYLNVRLLHSDKGVSAARNKGIEEAKGEWLVFLDADDKMSDDAIDVLVKDAKNASADVLFYGHMNGEEKRSVYESNSKSTFSGEQLDDCKIMVLSNPTRYLQVWAKLIRRKLVIDNGIRFNTALRLAEDSDFMLRCLEVAETIKIKPEIIYRYMVSDSSVMRSFDENKTNDYAFSMQSTSEVLSLHTKQLEIAYAKYVAMHFNVAMVRETFSCDNNSSIIQKINKMVSIYVDSIFSRNIELIPLKECVSPRLLPIACLKCKFYIGAALFYYLRAKQNKMREVNR